MQSTPPVDLTASIHIEPDEASVFDYLEPHPLTHTPPLSHTDAWSSMPDLVNDIYQVINKAHLVPPSPHTLHPHQTLNYSAPDLLRQKQSHHTPSPTGNSTPSLTLTNTLKRGDTSKEHPETRLCPYLDLPTQEDEYVTMSYRPHQNSDSQS